MTAPRLVVLESPYAGDVQANLEYARRALADSLARGEAPIASHLLYTLPGVLDDADPVQRAQGIAAGLAWSNAAEAAVFYVDRGWSPGMLAAMRAHRAAGTTVELRDLDTPRAPPLSGETVIAFLGLRMSEKREVAKAIGVERATGQPDAQSDRAFLDRVRDQTGKALELAMYVGAIIADRKSTE